MDASSSQDAVCVLYDRESGEIHFVHRVTTLGDLAPLADDELEAQAREELKAAAEFTGRDLAPDLAAAVVDPESFRSRRRYTVREGRLQEQ